MSHTLFPGLHRLAAEQSKYDGFQDEVRPTKDFVECVNCLQPREDWLFEDHSVCTGCGEIMERPIDCGAEYRFFGLEERGGGDPCRVGAPMDTRFPTSGLGTMILSHAHGGTRRPGLRWHVCGGITPGICCPTRSGLCSRSLSRLRWPQQTMDLMCGRWILRKTCT